MKGQNEAVLLRAEGGGAAGRVGGVGGLQFCTHVLAHPAKAPKGGDSGQTANSIAMVDITTATIATTRPSRAPAPAPAAPHPYPHCYSHHCYSQAQ